MREEHQQPDSNSEVVAEVSDVGQDAHASTAVAAATEPESTLRALRPFAIAVAIFAGALLLTFVLVRAGRDDPAKLDATKITLELSYPVSAAPAANLNGQPGAAPAGATVSCRSTIGKKSIGQGEAQADGAFDIPLNPEQWPVESVTREGYAALNSSLECRAGTGAWVKPLRQPRVRIN